LACSAASTGCAWPVTKLYPEVRHGNLQHAGFFIVQAVESQTHRFAAHPDEQAIGPT
jgi:hypothetical protein